MRKPIEQKQKEASKRQQEREMRTIQEQLDLITKRRGHSKKEKQKLLDQLLELQKNFHSHGNEAKRG